MPALAAVGAAAARVAPRRPRVAVVALLRRVVVDAARRRPPVAPDVLAAAVVVCPLPDARRRRVPVAAEVELADVVLLEALRGRPRVARVVVVLLAGRAGAVVLDPDVVSRRTRSSPRRSVADEAPSRSRNKNSSTCRAQSSRVFRRFILFLLLVQRCFASGMTLAVVKVGT